MTSGFVIGRRRGWGRGLPLLIAVMVAGVVGLQSDVGAAARGADWALHDDGGYVTSAQVVPGDEPRRCLGLSALLPRCRKANSGVAVVTASAVAPLGGPCVHSQTIHAH